MYVEKLSFPTNYAHIFLYSSAIFKRIFHYGIIFSMDTGQIENLPNSSSSLPDQKELRKQRLIIIGLGIIVIFCLGLLVFGLFFLLNPELSSNETVS